MIDSCSAFQHRGTWKCKVKLGGETMERTCVTRRQARAVQARTRAAISKLSQRPMRWPVPRGAARRCAPRRTGRGESPRRRGRVARATRTSPASGYLLAIRSPGIAEDTDATGTWAQDANRGYPCRSLERRTRHEVVCLTLSQDSRA